MVVKKSISINASRENVWEVLTKPAFIRQWDDLPEDYDDRKDLRLYAEITWKMDNGNFTKLTVTRFEPPSYLELALFLSSWKKVPAPGEVAYRYTVSDLQGHTVLSMTIGDFSNLENGENYYKESIRFADHSSEIIKTLAEKQTVL